MAIADLRGFIQLFRTWPHTGILRVSALHRVRFVPGVRRFEKLPGKLVFRVSMTRGVGIVHELFIVLVTEG